MAKENKENKVDAAKLEKLKVLQSTIDKIEKNYGKGSIMKLGISLLLRLILFQQAHLV